MYTSKLFILTAESGQKGEVSKLLLRFSLREFIVQILPSLSCAMMAVALRVILSWYEDHTGHGTAVVHFDFQAGDSRQLLLQRGLSPGPPSVYVPKQVIDICQLISELYSNLSAICSNAEHEIVLLGTAQISANRYRWSLTGIDRDRTPDWQCGTW